MKGQKAGPSSTDQQHIQLGLPLGQLPINLKEKNATIRKSKSSTLRSAKKETKCSTPHCRNRHAPNRSKCHKCITRKWRERYPLHDAFNNLRWSAKRRNISFTLSLEEFKTVAAKYDYINHRGKQAHSFTVDRINPLEGYHYNNVRFITNAANVAEGNRSRAMEYVWKKIYGIKPTEPDPF